ncbi:MAG: histidinol dehydrogenase, partial [Myxococcales bacterium]
AHLAGVTALVPVGGAQAVAALAFGTASIPRVEVIAGDGGLHSACARRLVLGHVQVDGLGGPSELLVLADGSADVGLVAADLLACAEAGEEAWPILLTSEARVVTAVQQELDRQLAGLPRRLAAASALTERGRALVVRQRQQLVEVAGRLAFDRVILHVERPDDLLDRLPAAGSVAWGPLTPAGVLPGGGAMAAGGAARFGGSAGVWAFLTRTACVHLGPTGLRAQADGVARLARADGREGQARATERRLGLPAARGVGGRELES